jgi:hypothetical protein
MLNWSYPDSLHVGTAVWGAQATGRLPRDELLDRTELTTEARQQFGYLRAARLLGQLRMALDGADRDAPRPALAVVLLGPVLWSRFEVQGAELSLLVHVDGPQAGDVVAVTEAPVIEALVAGRLDAHEALELGVIRLYGGSAESRGAREWLAAISTSQPGVAGARKAGQASEASAVSHAR